MGYILVILPFLHTAAKTSQTILDEKYNNKEVPGTGTPVFRIRANSHNFAVSDTTKHFVDAIEIEQHF